MSESRFNIDQVNLLIVRPHKSEIARFFGKIKVSAGTGCWVWENAQPGKYGRFFIRGTQHLAHRWAYAWLVEPLPIGHSAKTPVLDHLCRNTACVFPAHLELVSMAENTRRGIGVGRPALGKGQRRVNIGATIPTSSLKELKKLARKRRRSLARLTGTWVEEQLIKEIEEELPEIKKEQSS